MSIKLDLEEVCKTSKVTSILRSGLAKLVRYISRFRYIEVFSPGGGVLPNMGYIGMCGSKG